MRTPQQNGTKTAEHEHEKGAEECLLLVAAVPRAPMKLAKVACNKAVEEAVRAKEDAEKF